MYCPRSIIIVCGETVDRWGQGSAWLQAWKRHRDSLYLDRRALRGYCDNKGQDLFSRCMMCERLPGLGGTAGEEGEGALFTCRTLDPKQLASIPSSVCI